MAEYTVWVREVQAVPIVVQAEHANEAVDKIWRNGGVADYNNAIFCNRLDSSKWSIELPDGREIHCDDISNHIEEGDLV